MARQKKDAVEGLKDQLYSRKVPPHMDVEERTPLTNPEVHAPIAWSDIKAPAPTPSPAVTSLMEGPGLPNQKSHMSLATKFFIGSILFFFAAAGVAGYLFFVGSNTISPQNIDLQVVAPSLIDGGKATSIQILIDNRNSAPLQLVDLITDYPDGTRDPNDPTKTFTHDRQSIGTIAPGQQIKQTANAIFFGQEGTQQKVQVTLEYSISGSNAIFEKQSEADFTVGSSPVTVSVNAPSEAIAGQQFSIDLNVQSNATTPVDNVVVQGQYPFGFSFVSATPQADAGGTIWRLGTMAPGTSETIHLVGTIDGQDGDQRIFRFLAGSDADQTDTQIKVPFLSVPQTLTVHRPFITAVIAINGQTGKAVSSPAGQAVQGSVAWTNNLTDTVSDVQFELSLTGPSLDANSVSAINGFYQSSNSTIIWSKDQDGTLASIAPGATGVLPFSFGTLPPGSGGVLIANPTITLNLKVSGVRQGQDNVPENVSSAASAQVTISSILTLAAQALHFSGPFANTGPMPPIAEQNTFYTIVWATKNSSNAIANATVSAILPPYVTFLQAQAGDDITYDAQGRTVTWALGDIKAGVGFTLPARTGTFQVLFSPSTSQVAQSPTLTGPATLSGQDRFAQVQVQATAEGPSIVLTGDPGFGGTMGQVAPK